MSPDWSDVYHAYRRVRYKIDYHLIELRRKYYSNSRNPRVIHSKLKDGILTTLRTCPRDKYLTKPGEFLSIEGEEHEDIDDLVDMYLADPEDQLVDLQDTRSLAEDENKASADIFSAQSPTTQNTPASPQNDSDQLKSGELDKSEYTEPKGLPSKSKSSMSDLQKVWAKLPFTPSRMHTFINKSTSTTVTSKSVGAHQLSKSGACVGDDRKVWKTVLNDVSLSAARLSTGSDVASRDEFERLSGDFTDYKRKSVDVFADTLVHGRAKFHGKT